MPLNPAFAAASKRSRNGTSLKSRVRFAQNFGMTVLLGREAARSSFPLRVLAQAAIGANGGSIMTEHRARRCASGKAPNPCCERAARLGHAQRTKGSANPLPLRYGAARAPELQPAGRQPIAVSWRSTQMASVVSRYEIDVEDVE